ncbi:helix-turn-helix domain-containing protein [Streptococcus orisratti]|uniref:helix-turn-helix domain-containing protein n=1 Tax=Streptococcus orisratti TaxID=114652 RepID=UPI003D065B70
MSEINMGDLLREARVQKKLSLEDIEKQTKIPQHYLLAMELDQFNILPQEKLDPYLKDYTAAVGLNLADLMSSQQEPEEKLNTQEEKIDTVILPKTHEFEIPEKYESIRTLEISPSTSPITSTRSSRYRTKESRPSYLPIISLCFATLAILSFVFYTVWQQTKQSNQTKTSDYSVVSSTSSQVSEESSSTSETPISSSENQTTLTTTGSGDSLSVNVENANNDVQISISLAGAESSWVSVTNSEAGDGGTLLTSNDNNLTTKLLSGTTSSVITLGVTAGVTVTINGQAVDLSNLASTSVSYITLNIK